MTLRAWLLRSCLVACLAAVFDDDEREPATLVGTPRGSRLVEDFRGWPLRADAMIRGYFLAGGNTRGLAGFTRSSDLPLPIPWRHEQIGGVRIIADPNRRTRLTDGGAAFIVWITNETDESVWFDASDSRLFVVREALHWNGEWTAVEYVPRSWCGNSYHRVELPARTLWEFAAPVYDGALMVSMRFVLSIHKRGSEPIYSNVFRGRVTLDQFEKKARYSPRGIMDPYFE